MKKVLLTLSVACALSASAQITLDSTSYGRPGDKLYYGIDSTVATSVSVGAAGANQTWNFGSTFAADSYDSSEFFSAVGDPDAPAGANIEIVSGAGDVQYQEVTSNGVKLLIDQPQFGITGIKLQLLKFPLHYMDSTMDTTTVHTKGKASDFGFPSTPSIDSVAIDAFIKVSTKCDAWGALTTPAKAGYNTLRVMSKTYQKLDIFAHSTLTGNWTPVTSQEDSSLSYMWFGINSKSYIAMAQMDENNHITGFSYIVDSVPHNVNTGLRTLAADAVDFITYPNPASDMVHISFNGQSATAELSDLAGKVVKTAAATNGTVSMNVSDLANGVYFCTITGNGFRAVQKVMISK